MKRLLKLASVLTLGAALATGTSFAQTQGVTDTEVVIGSSNDLSGIFAAFGAPAVQAAQLYFDEVNENGGVHGRQIKFIVEDHGYQLPKATSAINKLVNRDKIFAMFLQLGTPMNIASFPLLQSKQIANVFPLTLSSQLLEEPIDYRYAPGAPYYEQMSVGISYLAEEKGAEEICSMFIPTDFGTELQSAAKDVATEMGLTYAAETTHKPDDADFVGSLTRLKEAGCDVVAVALGVRQIITAYVTAGRMGWTDVSFITTAAGFHSVIAKVPGGVTEGLYAAAPWADVLARMDNPTVAAWVQKYLAASGEQLPSSGALLGRSGAEVLVRALEAAGPDLTPATFKAGMESLDYYDEILDGQMNYSAIDHSGADQVVVSVIEDGNWKEIFRE
ncbi:MAG: ABC transporter substrate-binding protein [Devosiaceae bacterium]|nr:ABC transporter substrate-binding protein [Devosiaceae bacterium]